MHRAILALALGAGLAAQSVHLVGPGGLPQISMAIAIAAPGDIVEVAAGTYEPFTLDKALTVRSRSGALVTVLATTSSIVAVRPPVGEVASLSGIEFRSPGGFFFTGALDVRIERGTVFCEDCIFEGGTGPALMVSGATAVLRACTFLGGTGTNGVGAYNAGIACLNAQVFASDCSMRGSNTAFKSFGAGGEGARINASDAHFVRCRIDGGNQNGCFANPPGVGVWTTGASRLWMTDCTVRGGGNACGDGTTGLLHEAALPAQLARNQISGGLSIGGSPGMPIIGTVQTVPLLGLAAATVPLVRGATWSNTWLAQPGAAVAVFVGFSLSARGLPGIEEPVLLDGTIALQSLLVADAAGNAALQFAVPATPALQGVRAFFEGVTPAAPTVRTSPPVGGVVQ